MKIKQTIYGLAAIAVLSACSNIADDERLIYVKPAEVARCVLIEDFTGQACVNCPTATDEIEKIIEEYGADNIVAVGIHSGPFGFAGTAQQLGLMTDIGNEYFNYWGNIDHQPMGIVNRVGNPTDFDLWASLVYSEIQKTTPVSITLSSNYDEAALSANIKAEVFCSERTEGKLQVWITEDNITAIQILPSGTVDMNYVHNHVFRAAVNGTWGETVSINEGETIAKQYACTPETGWNADNLSVIAFLYDDNGVMQVAKTAFKNKAAEN